MTQFKKFTFALAAVVALVAWASTANAQVAFQMSSNIRGVRVEGISEAVGAVTLTATTAGNISINSTITFDYGVDIVAGAGVPDPVDPFDVFPGDPDLDAPADCVDADVAFDTDDALLILTFLATCHFDVGGSIVIEGLRVDAFDAGDGATINAKGSASVPAGQPPITFFIVNQVPVAEVGEAFRIRIDQGKTVLTCAESDVEIVDPDDLTDAELAQAVRIRIEENFNQAFSNDTDENGYADYGVGAEVTQTFIITFKDVPTDVNIELIDINLDSPAGPPTLAIAGIVEGDDEDGDGGDIVFEFTITTTASTGANEEVELIFVATTTEPIDSVNGGVLVDVGVSFEGGDLGGGTGPEFVDNETEDAAFNVTDCLSRLLLTWVVSNVAGYDTGVAIANTTEDDAAFGADDLDGAVAQSGTCKLTGYPSGGGSPVAFTTPSVAAGRTHAMVFSQTTGFSGFAGYVLVVCNFLNAHAFAFITNGFGSVAGPTLSQGYLGNVVPSGTRVLADGESLSD